MIVKARTIPLKLLILAAILRRLPLTHHKYQAILGEFKRREAGYHGEVSLDYYLRSLPQEKYLILHDLNLPDGGYNCQIDTLLLTPEFGLIIDVKNMIGKLIFDTENEQFIQINNDKEKGYPDPIAQAERHKAFIKKWLAANGFHPVPIDYMVVIGNPYATYVLSGPNARKVKPRVCKADAFLSKIQFFENLYSTSLLNPKELRKICRLLVKMNTPPTKFLLEKFGIKQSDLLTGILGPCCNYLPLIRKKQKWYCPRCDNYFVDAHIAALLDYFLLFDMKITNRQFREFCHLDSIHTAKRLLMLSGKVNYSGIKKGRCYFPKVFPW
ncbi:nuclease-related domain-containing protein [Neobacillus soli]|uniref:nuclease-related domain-containing protein n=1 Tax=Neobacillus soli TaxID=220688 RepID=UPI00082489F0|nr:nuclease-related domain-containing protein [Neobacillus soli]